MKNRVVVPFITSLLSALPSGFCRHFVETCQRRFLRSCPVANIKVSDSGAERSEGVCGGLWMIQDAMPFVGSTRPSHYTSPTHTTRPSSEWDLAYDSARVFLSVPKLIVCLFAFRQSSLPYRRLQGLMDEDAATARNYKGWQWQMSNHLDIRWPPLTHTPFFCAGERVGRSECCHSGSISLGCSLPAR